MHMQNETHSQKPSWLYPIIGFAFITLGVFLFSLTRNAWKENDFIGKSEEFPHSITVSGKGEVFAVPDIATISLGLRTEKVSVADAQKENTKKINALIDELKKMDIPKDDIRTTQYSVYPVYDWSNGKQILRAYAVEQNVMVKIRNFDKIPKTLELVGALELNQVGGLEFTVDDIEKFEQDARLLAIREAKEKAETLAKEAGVRLGRIISFNENDFAPPIPYYLKETRYDAGFGGAAESAPAIEPGRGEITIMVSITYEVL